MRKEALDWWKQALADIDTAKIDIENHKYYAASFWSQQAAEKALKAFYLETKKQPFFGHSLIYLARELKAPSEVVEASAFLNPEYAVSRYPDAAAGVPSEVHTQELSSLHAAKAKVIIAWIKLKLNL